MVALLNACIALPLHIGSLDFQEDTSVHRDTGLHNDEAKETALKFKSGNTTNAIERYIQQGNRRPA
jgi:hypothetical protein